MMRVKIFSIFVFFAVFSIIVNAQEMIPNKPIKANVKIVVTPEYVPSIASRISEIPPYVDFVKEAQDKRSLGNTVIIGKDRQLQDDYYVRNRHEAAQSVRVASPSLVFDAYSSSTEPTDPTVAIGPNHIVVVYNTAFIIYDKSGNLLAGPMTPSPSIFPNPGCCDQTISYDAAADRWVVTLLGFGNGAQIAVSDGPDPINDGWYNYSITSLDDYQKLSVWSDGYYITSNKIGSNKVWALEREAMLAGEDAQIMGFNLPGIQTTSYYSPQAFNVSNNNLPAAGGATFVYLQDDAWDGVEEDHVKLWTLYMDWDAGNGTMSAATELPTTPFISVFDGGSFSNLEQPGGGASVDAIQATIMNQAQFRKFEGYNSAVFNFVVDTDASEGELAGVRWFELRQSGDNQPWSVYQEGTYIAPNGKHAWMASMVMDGQGNIAMGYTSMAGPTTPNPTDYKIGSYYTGRLNGDPLGVMTVIEEVIAVGDENLPGFRYGDYSKIDIDPTDDTTFWFINEYMNDGRKGVIGSFSLLPPTPNDIGVSSIIAPNTGELTANEDVVVEIKNFGSNDITNPEVQYIINGNPPIIETFIGTIVAGNSELFTFSTQANLSIYGEYLIASKTLLDGDSNPNNDQATKTVINGVDYCEPMIDCSSGDGFRLVSIEQIYNESECEAYGDFTDMVATLEPGNTYEITLTVGYGNQWIKVWIDFNDDGVFDTTEIVVPDFLIEGTGQGLFTETFDLTIPAETPYGYQHRMRVKANYNNPVPDDACEVTTYGETEDYTVNMNVLSVEDISIVESELVILTLPNNQFDITLHTDFEGIASIEIYTILGQTLSFNNLEKKGDNFTYHLDMSYADTGVYFIKIGDRASKTYKTAKIIVK